MPPTFGATVEVVVAKLQDRIKRHAQATVEQEKMSLLSELPLLEDIARGKRGGSWKEHLVEDSPWADVLREAEYYLLWRRRLDARQSDSIVLARPGSLGQV